MSNITVVPTKHSSSTEFFVLGMHRSGTSLTTEIMVNLGCYFGEESESIGLNDENPRGFWERRDARNCNDAILLAHSSEWFAISDYLRVTPSEKRVQELTKACSDVIKQMKSVSLEPLVLKEPRMCFTLDYWLQAAKDPKLVIVHRDPVEIAASLHRRNSFSVEFALGLWYQYMCSALKFATRHNCLFLNYSDLISSPIESVQKLQQFIGRSCDDRLLEKAINCVDQTLYRNKASRKLEPSLALTEGQRSLNKYLVKLCKNNFQADRDIMEGFDTTIGAAYVSGEKRVLLDNYYSEKAKSAEMVLALSRTKEKYLDVLELARHKQNQMDEFAKSLRGKNAKLSEYEIAVRNKNATLSEYEIAVRNKNAKIEALTQDVVDRNAKIKALTNAVNAKKAPRSTS